MTFLADLNAAWWDASVFHRVLVTLATLWVVYFAAAVVGWVGGREP